LNLAVKLLLNIFELAEINSLAKNLYFKNHLVPFSYLQDKKSGNKITLVLQEIERYTTLNCFHSSRSMSVSVFGVIIHLSLGTFTNLDLCWESLSWHKFYIMKDSR